MQNLLSLAVNQLRTGIAIDEVFLNVVSHLRSESCNPAYSILIAKDVCKLAITLK